MTVVSNVAARFARDTAKHVMTALHEDGLYRHLRFAAPEGGFYWYDLITTPYTLIFRGDGEAFVFTIDATEDMFVLFRKSSYKGSINLGYWSEKLRSNQDSATAYSEDLFKQEVAKDLELAEEDYPGITEAWAEHLDSEFNTEYEAEARRALDEFRFGEQYRASCSGCDWQFDSDSSTDATLKAARHRRETGDDHTTSTRDLTFSFSDTWEWRLQDFDWWFLWACHAIVWGITRYDKVRRYGLERLAAGDLVANALAESRCIKTAPGCGKPLIAADGTTRVFWDDVEAKRYEAEWRQTGLCPDCQDAARQTAEVAA